MTEKAVHQHRKDEHLSLAIKYWREKLPKNSFDDLRFVPAGFPEMAIKDVDLSVQLFDDLKLDVPFYIEAMTGGSDRGNRVNEQLAELAKNQKIAMAVGSQSIALKYPELADGFEKIRKINPDGILFANMGAGNSLEAAKKVVDMIAANALEVHINVAQELTMDEGDREFYWLENINEIALKLEVPVIVKEVGFGMSETLLKQLSQTAVSAINIGGSGGTNFAWIERNRSTNGLNLDNFGLTTVESLREMQNVNLSQKIIATGGINKAEDIVKAQILGATAASSAGFILSNLMKSGIDETEKIIEQWKSDLPKIYTLLGARNLTELQKSKLR